MLPSVTSVYDLYPGKMQYQGPLPKYHTFPPALDFPSVGISQREWNTAATANAAHMAQGNYKAFIHV